jgi:ACDE family multidrug resistance protein
VFAFPSIVLAPVMGVIADRFGRRTVLIPSLVGFGLAGVAITFTRDLDVLLTLRFLQGCAASGLITLSLTLVGDVFDGAQRNTVMGVNTAAMTIGVATYPVIGGYLADIRWDLPFLVYGVGILVGLFAFLTLEEPAVESGSLDMRYLREAAERVLTWNGFALYGVVFTMFLLYFGVVNTAIPFLLS